LPSTNTICPHQLIPDYLRSWYYPLIYLYTAWVGDQHLSLAQSYPGALLVFFGSFALAYASLKLYDEPVRNWLKRRFLLEPKANGVPASRQ
jgi:peptidoglycan/LPS O-acetylase OafA/YrhL